MNLSANERSLLARAITVTLRAAALLEVDGLGDGDSVARFVRVRCPSTGREYMLRVSPTTETARAGVAATFEIPADQYRPSVET